MQSAGLYAAPGPSGGSAARASASLACHWNEPSEPFNIHIPRGAGTTVYVGACTGTGGAAGAGEVAASAITAESLGSGHSSTTSATSTGVAGAYTFSACGAGAASQAST